MSRNNFPNCLGHAADGPGVDPPGFRRYKTRVVHALEEEFPELTAALPRSELAQLPTPVDEVMLAGGLCRLWIKRDDLSGRLYGGNKVRKLEYLLGEALHTGARKVMTFGTAGSNHALATGIYARECGLQSISMLTPQINARYVGRNLLMGLKAEIEFHAYPDDAAARRAVPWVRMQHRLRDGVAPTVIAGGGSSPLGTIGFVNAGFELRAQIDQGALPHPDYIYVALGTMGTAAGLLLGMRAAGIDSKLVCVRVVQEKFANAEKFLQLAGTTARHIRHLTARFPVGTPDYLDPEFRHEFYGGQYARFTREGMAAVRCAAGAGAPGLEGTYTGKAFAALLHDHNSGRLRGKNVLFWNTYNSRPFPVDMDVKAARQLPAELQAYFTRPVQPLDKRE